MGSVIYFVVGMLFLIHIFWTWNNSKDFDNYFIRISFLVVGTLFMTFITLLIFSFAKIGVEYPKTEMIGEVRKIILLLFIPINSFAILPQIARLLTNVKDGDISEEDRNKKIRATLIIFGILVIIECIYFKNIQNGIISAYMARM